MTSFRTPARSTFLNEKIYLFSHFAESGYIADFLSEKSFSEISPTVSDFLAAHTKSAATMPEPKKILAQIEIQKRFCQVFKIIFFTYE